MKLFVLLVTVVASVHSSITGWSTTPAPGWPSTTTTGWPSTTTPEPGWPSTTTEGWSTTTGWPSTTTKGWGGSKAGWGDGWNPNSATTPGWGKPNMPSGSAPSLIPTSIADLYGQLSVAGAGWTAGNHQEAAIVTGGWEVPAQLSVSSGGNSIVNQAGGISQVTQGQSNEMSALNLNSHSQIAAGGENAGLIAVGVDAIYAQGGDAISIGEGYSESGSDATIISGQNK